MKLNRRINSNYFKINIWNAVFVVKLKEKKFFERKLEKNFFNRKLAHLGSESRGKFMSSLPSLLLLAAVVTNSFSFVRPARMLMSRVHFSNKCSKIQCTANMFCTVYRHWNKVGVCYMSRA